MKHKPFALFALAACAPSVSRLPAPAPDPEVRPRPSLVAQLGHWDDDEARFVRSTRFLLEEGTSYTWRIRLPCTGPVLFREVQPLPAPGDWTFSLQDMPGTTISEDRTTTTTVDYAACVDGWIEHTWVLAANDPPGQYVITVSIDGYPPQTFRPRFIAAAP